MEMQMDMRDFGILASILLGILNLWLNYQKDKRDKKKLEKEEKDKEEQKKKEQIESEKTLLKNALISLDTFTREALILLREDKKAGKTRYHWYLKTRSLHLFNTVIQDYKFREMNTLVKNNDNEDIKNILAQIHEIRNSLVKFREPFRLKNDSSKELITDGDVNALAKIQQKIDVISKQYNQAK